MQFPFLGIGVVFDIDGLASASYGYRVWQLFMKHIDPKRVAPGILLEGDTALTLNGDANEFCIAIYGPSLDLDYVRDTFESMDEPGLAPFHRRFIEKPAIDDQPLLIRGKIDSLGRLVTEEWSREELVLCREYNWGYLPEVVPSTLDPSLKGELEVLQRPRFD